MEETITEIEEFMQTARTTWHDCVLVPTDCDVEKELGDIYGGELLQVNIDDVARQAAQGYEVKAPLDEKHDQFIIENIDIALPTSNTATITYCVIDGFIMFDPGAAPDGTDVIIDDTIVVVREQSELTRQDGSDWRMTTNNDLESFSSDEGCFQ